MYRDCDFSMRASSLVVHWVGGATEEVFNFLGPATAALAELGVSQILVAFDDSLIRQLLPRLHLGVTPVLVPMMRNPVSRWARAFRTVREIARRDAPRAIHLHGFVPGLVGPLATREYEGQPRLLYSPHGSRLGSARGPGFAMRLASQSLGLFRKQHLIASRVGDARRLSELTRQAVELVESPVSEIFFQTDRKEARHPLVVAGAGAIGTRSVEVLTQLAVLLGDKSLRMRFKWQGEADAASAAQLHAAHVLVHKVGDEPVRASSLATAWIYLLLTEGENSSRYLMESMAAGVPCLASDTPDHRDLLRHGETGFLYSDASQILDCLAQLIDSKELRVRIGEAARKEAAERFGAGSFRDSLHSAYEWLDDAR